MAKPSFVLFGLLLITKCMTVNMYEHRLMSFTRAMPSFTKDASDGDDFEMSTASQGGGMNLIPFPRFRSILSRNNDNSDIHTKLFSRTMDLDPFSMHRSFTRKFITDNGPSIFSSSPFQKLTSQYKQNTDQPADGSKDSFADDTATQDRGQLLSSHLSDMINLSNNLMSKKTGNIPADSAAMSSLGAGIKQTQISFNGGEGIMTEIVIHRCCVDKLCYTPDKGQACDPTKIPLQKYKNDEQQKPMENVQLSKNITPTAEPLKSHTLDIDDQNYSDYLPPTGSADKSRKQRVQKSGNQQTSKKKSSNTVKPKLKSEDSNLYESTSPIDNSNKTNKGLGSFKGESNGLGYENQSKSNSLNGINDIKRRVLETTNYYREKHGLAALQLDSTLSDFSQEWADYLSRTSTFDHRTNLKYGENLYQAIGLDDVGKEAVDSWYNEMAIFKPDGSEMDLISNHQTLHMTQLLWKRSEKLGIGVAKSEDGTYVVVCNYDPQGNVYNQFRDNLPTITQKDIEDASLALEQKKNNMKTKFTIGYTN